MTLLYNTTKPLSLLEIAELEGQAGPIVIKTNKLPFYGSMNCGARATYEGPLIRRDDLQAVLKEIIDDESNVLENLNKLIKFIE